MKLKEKQCSFCSKMAVLWKSNPKTCAACAKKQAAKQAIERHRGVFEHKGLVQTESGGCAVPFEVGYRTKEHKKHLTYYQKQLQLYKVVSKQFIKDHPICQAQIEGCLGKADQVHHKRGRNGFLNDTTTFLACCDNCHRFIEANVAWAKEKGFSLSRLSKAI